MHLYHLVYYILGKSIVSLYFWKGGGKGQKEGRVFKCCVTLLLRRRVHCVLTYMWLPEITEEDYPSNTCAHDIVLGMLLRWRDDSIKVKW
jgi:hypothetical protein